MRSYSFQQIKNWGKLKKKITDFSCQKKSDFWIVWKKNSSSRLKREAPHHFPLKENEPPSFKSKMIDPWESRS